MKKTVNVNGSKIKVDFVNTDKRIFISEKKEFRNFVGERKEVVIEWITDCIYLLNGKKYTFRFHGKENKQGRRSYKIEFDSRMFPESEKKVIEYILENEK